MIILSCGCQSGDFGIEAEWDTFSREGKPAIECGFICQKHFELYDARTSEPDEVPSMQCVDNSLRDAYQTR
jgi:hypothetical protein